MNSNGYNAVGINKKIIFYLYKLHKFISIFTKQTQHPFSLHFTLILSNLFKKMEGSNKGECKKKMVGSGSKVRTQDKRGGSGGSSVPFHPYLGFANQTQPPFYFNQPMHQPFGYDSQPLQI
ncbi:hypothetical protein HanPI659440_Chr01g0009501 [Helianthus annuus]|nr:hypothetical protein HanPI659440_Chr01g0009501 [Helianthus annuus]